jgi:hypothetical protein
MGEIRDEAREAEKRELLAGELKGLIDVRVRAREMWKARPADVLHG